MGSSGYGEKHWAVSSCGEAGRLERLGKLTQLVLSGERSADGGIRGASVIFGNR